METQKEFQFRNIKPYKTGVSHGIPIVVKMVSNEVMEALELLSIKDAYLERIDLFNFGRLILPNNPPLRIKQEYLLSILEWCKRDDTVYIGENISAYKICDGALNYIKSWTK